MFADLSCGLPAGVMMSNNLCHVVHYSSACFSIEAAAVETNRLRGVLARYSERLTEFVVPAVSDAPFGSYAWRVFAVHLDALACAVAAGGHSQVAAP